MTSILVVDDHEKNRYLLHTLLTAAGYEVLETENGSQALELARRARPDLIISDILMPQMDGFAFCRECKQDQSLRDVPFVFYSATYTDPRDRDFAMQLGATRFIIKPVEGEAFIAMVREVLEEYAAGKLSASRPPPEEEAVIYRLYSETLVRKLEEKLLQLDVAIQALELEVAERKRSEKLLQHQATILGNIHDSVVVTDLEGHINYFNAGASVIFGYSGEEMLGKSTALLYPEQEPLLHTTDLQRIMEGEAYVGEWKGRHKNGETVWVDFKATLMRDAEGHVAGFIGVAKDITERKRAEDALRRRVEQLQTLRAIDHAITSSLDARLTLSILLEQITAQLRVDAAGVLLFNPNSLTLEYAAGRGFHLRDYEHSRLRLGEGLAGQAALERRLMQATNLLETPDFTRASLFRDERFVTHIVTPFIAKGEIKGVLEVFHRQSLHPDTEWLDFLETVAGQATIAIDNIQLFSSLQRSNAELRLAYDTTIEGWSRALDLRDKETEGHTQRVTDWTLKLARAAGMSDDELGHVRRGALLHDIGKLGVPDSILLKPDELTDEEWVMMRRHPQLAYDLLSPIAYLRPALDIPYCHHEKWDGTGYPRQLKGEQIPLEARLFAVIDVWDALRSDRPYRKGWPEERVREYLRAQVGVHFDPAAINVFFQVMQETSD